MNPLYQMLSGGASPMRGAPSFMPQNPVQQLQAILQAMTNPAAFMKQQFPDIPDEISNNPGQIFNYLQQTRGGVTGQQVQEAQQLAGQIIGTGSVK